MGAKIGVLLNCGQQSQFSKVRREFDAGRVNLDPPMTCADWPVPGNLALLHPQTAYTRKPLQRDYSWPVTPEYVDIVTIIIQSIKHVSIGKTKMWLIVNEIQSFETIIGYVIILQTCQPGECFRGTFRVKKRDLPAKSGTVGRAHSEIFFRSRPLYSLHKSIAFQNTLYSTATRPR